MMKNNSRYGVSGRFFLAIKLDDSDLPRAAPPATHVESGIFGMGSMNNNFSPRGSFAFVNSNRIFGDGFKQEAENWESWFEARKKSLGTSDNPENNEINDMDTEIEWEGDDAEASGIRNGLKSTEVDAMHKKLKRAKIGYSDEIIDYTNLVDPNKVKLGVGYVFARIQRRLLKTFFTENLIQNNPSPGWGDDSANSEKNNDSTKNTATSTSSKIYSYLPDILLRGQTDFWYYVRKSHMPFATGGFFNLNFNFLILFDEGRPEIKGNNVHGIPSLVELWLPPRPHTAFGISSNRKAWRLFHGTIFRFSVVVCVILSCCLILLFLFLVLMSELFTFVAHGVRRLCRKHRRSREKLYFDRYVSRMETESKNGYSNRSSRRDVGLLLSRGASRYSGEDSEILTQNSVWKHRRIFSPDNNASKNSIFKNSSTKNTISPPKNLNDMRPVLPKSISDRSSAKLRQMKSAPVIDSTASGGDRPLFILDRDVYKNSPLNTNGKNSPSNATANASSSRGSKLQHMVSYEIGTRATVDVEERYLDHVSASPVSSRGDDINDCVEEE